ncbi:MAG: hypothetical protein OXQ28_00295 [Acidobacteriota bacterium]|nr:hypothetical protein [Acidobacteriota bacterium]
MLSAIASKITLLLPLDTNRADKPVASAEKIRHTETVPGTTDNDGNSWRKHLAAGIAANRDSVRQALARLDTIGNFIDEDGFAVVTADQAEAGYAYQARDGALPANQSLALVAGNQDTTIASAPSSGIVLYMRVPAGIDPESVRIDHRRGGSLVTSYPRAADAWERFTALTGRSPHYDYYRLVDDALGSVISISGVQANDSFVMRVHGHESALGVGSIIVVPDGSPLPELGDYDSDQVIFWRGGFYRKSDEAGNFAASFRSAHYSPSGTGAFGVATGFYGQWIINPDNAFFVVSYHVGSATTVWIDKSAYETAKGSAVAAGDQLSITIATVEDAPRTETETFTYEPGVATSGYVAFTDGSDTDFGNVLDADSVGDIVTLAIERGGVAFMSAPGNHEQWTRVDVPDTALAEDVEELRLALEDQATPSNARLDSLEDKASEVRFDDQPSWATEPNTAVGGKHPYGGWTWVRSGGNPASYAGQDYDDFAHAGGSGFAGPGRGLIWVLPNNINWSKVRLVVRRSNGTVRSVVTGQSLRNAPASVVVANLPGAPPDVTVRWSASSDTAPYAVSNIQTTDTIALETLSDHTPIWEGGLGAGVVDEQSLSEEVVEHINRYEASQGRVEIGTDTHPLTVGHPTPIESEEGVVQDAALAHAIRIGNATGLHRALQVNMDVDVFLQRAGSQARTTGFMTSVELFIEVVGDPQSRTRLIDQRLALANFLTQFDAAGAATYSGSADFTQNVDMNIDVSGWDLEEGDRIQLRAVAFGVEGNAHAQLRFRNTAIIYDELASSVRQVPEFPAEGERAGKSLKFAGNSIGWHPTFQRVEELASRSSLSGGWTIPTVNRLGADNSITQAGTTLHIGAHSALRSGTWGVIVEVSNTGGTMRTFIPWAMFRTGSGTYVTGGGHGTQGIPVGYWNNNNDSELVATADWASEHGRFELTIAGPTRTGESTIRVWSAQ